MQAHAKAPRADEAWVLGDAETVLGFRLAGLRGRVVDSRDTAVAALAELRAAGASLVVVTDALCEALGGPRALAGESLRPVVAVVPSALGPRAAVSLAAEIARSVRRALGIPAERQA